MTAWIREMGRVAERALHERGEVVRIEGAVAVVATSLGPVRASRAFSCLVEPLVGDQVLLSVSTTESFVLAVLVRPSAEGQPTRVTFPGDVELAAAGTLSLTGREGLTVDGGPRLSVRARLLEALAGDTKLSAGRVETFAREVVTRATAVSTIAQRVDAVVETLTEHLMTSFRKVEGSATTRARDIDTQASRLMSMKAHNATIVADSVVRIDGDQIHMG